MITLLNKVISVHNKKTSMRLTNVEWNIINKICNREKIKRKTLLELIEDTKADGLGFTSSVRLFTLLYMDTQKSKVRPNPSRILKVLKKMQ